VPTLLKTRDGPKFGCDEKNSAISSVQFRLASILLSGGQTSIIFGVKLIISAYMLHFYFFNTSTQQI